VLSRYSNLVFLNFVVMSVDIRKLILEIGKKISLLKHNTQSGCEGEHERTYANLKHQLKTIMEHLGRLRKRESCSVLQNQFRNYSKGLKMQKNLSYKYCKGLVVDWIPLFSLSEARD
jgi:hypothetical protein